ncbi:MAG: hypothetical protein HQL83_16950 [Magnetococcales bacterium]|nr:hypothetical protein [Magnetococcales bacterium]
MAELRWGVIEAALLLMVPFWRHVALSLAERDGFPQVAALETIIQTVEVTPARRAYQLILERRPQMVRKIDWLRARGRQEEAEWLGWWLLHHAFLATPSLWSLEDGDSLLPEAWRQITWA